MSASDPQYPTGHRLLEGKTVLVTAAAGTGIGFATAKRCAEEGARVAISDLHERRLGEAADALAEITGEAPGLRSWATSATRPMSRACSTRSSAATAASTCSSTTPASAAPRCSST